MEPVMALPWGCVLKRLEGAYAPTSGFEDAFRSDPPASSTPPPVVTYGPIVPPWKGMTICQQVRLTGAVLELKQGGMTVGNTTPAVLAAVKTHKAAILAELATESESPIRKIANWLRTIKFELERVYVAGADKPKCMTLYDGLDAILVEEDDPQEFFAAFNRTRADLFALVQDIEGTRVLEGKELEQVARRISEEKPKPTTKAKANAGAFA